MNRDLFVKEQNGIATITFNRPGQRNAINYEGWIKLREIANNLSRCSSVRVVVLTGADLTPGVSEAKTASRADDSTEVDANDLGCVSAVA